MTSFPSACEVLRSKTWRPTPGQEIILPSSILNPMSQKAPEEERFQEKRPKHLRVQSVGLTANPQEHTELEISHLLGKKKKKIFSLSLDKDFPWRKRGERIFRSPTLSFKAMVLRTGTGKIGNDFSLRS